MFYHVHTTVTVWLIAQAYVSQLITLLIYLSFYKCLVFSVSLYYYLIDYDDNQANNLSKQNVGSKDSKYEIDWVQRYPWSAWELFLWFCDLPHHLCVWIRFETVAQEILRSQWCTYKTCHCKVGEDEQVCWPVGWSVIFWSKSFLFLFSALMLTNFVMFWMSAL